MRALTLHASGVLTQTLNESDEELERDYEFEAAWKDFHDQVEAEDTTTTDDWSS